MSWQTLGVWVILQATHVFGAFYLPGVAPVDFHFSDPVTLEVNSLTSSKNPLKYDYYYLDFCQSKATFKDENLGEKLSMDSIRRSSYQINMMVDDPCHLLCSKDAKQHETDKMADLIRESYVVNWVLDNMPAATQMQDGELLMGFPLGFINGDLAYIYNHAEMTIFYHKSPPSEACSDCARVVGFEVVPRSVKHFLEEDSLYMCSAGLSPTELPAQPVEGEKVGKTIAYSYSVQWRESEITWSTRWDVYFTSRNSIISWNLVLQSFGVILLLSVLVATIMLRILKKELTTYTDEDDIEGARADLTEEVGWKTIHTEVFRAPPYPYVFACFIGTGVQITFMCFFTLLFAILGFLSPANRGALLVSFFVLFALMGFPAGYAATQTLNMWGIKDWKKTMLATAVSFPGLIGFCLVAQNIVAVSQDGVAVPFSSLLLLMLMWLGISLPLTYMGAYSASKIPTYKPPCKPNITVRGISPRTSISQHPAFPMLCGGAITYTACFYEMQSILSSVWGHHYYYMFGLLAIVFIQLVVMAVEMSIVIVYVGLTKEDYRWWWRSFLTPGLSALFLFISALKFVVQNDGATNGVAFALYFGYSWILATVFFLFTGAVGHLGCRWFVVKIYSSLKVD